MGTFIKALYLAGTAMLLASSPVGATPSMALSNATGIPASAQELFDARPETAPIAFVKFCLEHSAQCESRGATRRISLTDDAWEEIAAVNATVNRRIHPDADKGPFDWSLDTTSGNCNDYAVQKRQALIQLGYPMSALSLTATMTPSGVGHLILTVRTDRGDFVLDNLRSSIVAWNRTGYRMLKRQSAADPQTWVSVATFNPDMRVARNIQPSIARTRAPARIARGQAPAPVLVASVAAPPSAWLQETLPVMAPFSLASVSLPDMAGPTFAGAFSVGDVTVAALTPVLYRLPVGALTYGALIGVSFGANEEAAMNRLAMLGQPDMSAFRL
jgi:predicted transglutaminase-like cysteine proteinase